MAELKPCPFCGGEAEIHEERLEGYTIFFVSCENNKCSVIVETMHRAGYTKAQAIEEWNRRAGDINA